MARRGTASPGIMPLYAGCGAIKYLHTYIKIYGIGGIHVL